MRAEHLEGVRKGECQAWQEEKKRKAVPGEPQQMPAPQRRRDMP